MNVYYTNINNVNEEIEDFVIAKNKIEKPLIESGKLEKKMSIKDFFEYIDLTKYIYLIGDKDNSVIPFQIFKPNNDDLVVVYSSTLKVDKPIEEFKEELERIKFNLNNLTKRSELDILNGNFSIKKYFILNGEFYS